MLILSNVTNPFFKSGSTNNLKFTCKDSVFIFKIANSLSFILELI